MVRDSDRETKRTVCKKTIQIYVYADNIVSVGGPTGVLKEAIINHRKAAKEMRLNLQTTKDVGNNKA